MSANRAMCNELLEAAAALRRQFLRQLLAAGAAVTAPAALPAMAEQNFKRAQVAGGAGPESIAQTLAQFAVTLRYEDLPADVVRAVKRTILDTIGCAIGGYQAGPSQIAVRLAADVSASQSATLFCSGLKTSQERAAFANGVMIRCLDFNDAYSTPVSGGHPSDALGALLSSAEVAGRSGRDLIVATALAYEVFCKICDVLDSDVLGIDHATVLGLASLVGASQLMGLTREQLVNAIGITVGGNTALNQGRVGTLSNWKDFATAEASRKAIFSAQLAQAGMTGPSQIFEGPAGFFKVISRGPFVLPRLGEPFGILRAVTKRFALGQYAQSVAAAAVEMRSFFGNTDEIGEVNIAVSHHAMGVMADTPDKWRPQSHETADHSMPYAAAVVLMYGTIEDHYYDDPYRDDPRLLDLLSRVRISPSAQADLHQKDYNQCDFEVVLKSGARKSVQVKYQRGHWKNPMTDGEMEEKFRSLARAHLPAERIDALLQQLWRLEQMPKAGDLVGMTRI
jgi:2-methylcitrate dehydratase